MLNRDAIDKSLSYLEVDTELHVDFFGNANSSASAKSIEKAVTDDITDKTSTVTFMFDVAGKLLSLSLLVLFLQAAWYVRNYLAKDGFDNIYITKAFRQYDVDNADGMGRTVLPLKPKESGHYVDATSLKLNKLERKYFKIGFVQVLLHFALCLVLILCDYSLHYVLYLINKYGNNDLAFQTQGSVNVTVVGTGPIADFYRSLVTGLSIEKGFYGTLHLNKCLPQPSEPNWVTITFLVFLYLVALLFVILSGYGMRLRRKIAAFYYPEQEAARVAFLHKTIRHRRAGQQWYLRQQVKSAHKESEVKTKLRFSTWIKTRCPCVEKCQGKTPVYTCLGCGETHVGGVAVAPCGRTDGRTPGGGTCVAVFCSECLVAMGGSCPVCEQEEVTRRY